ncbi:conserved hypothetical protein [Sulfolobus islandicus Y.G.57.14]|jgi:hypothetical protein|uniref:Nucleotidyl transferase AbiEii/AbiGii toxin family protein n=6 Tax=Saccharolobus islandicus TaxID=43080 RepID=C3MNA3_SACI2|nr:hypothetical protein [Sulfolobus islandicus]ACP36846.1 conserved hypothetical protein [Sulfolobus islandicus L.S.2.15]ACP39455.1 conserved hypothetical protein [Sulfolobus islandicus M.14.25]ACP47146.1 conserved hypothetical protein [Sulfolobus islandicus Y.G.57.14]ACP56637.1 conserved hypothetical protein [Sulfolobus islandicus M.16.27]ACR43323.1 conserved hypothetical protein [Sulfolobus islandicus M.16.4]
MTVTKEQLLNRAIEVIDKANNEGITLRAIGGAAIALIAKKGSELYPRVYKDIDYFGLSSQSSKISKFLEGIGLIPNKRFNALHGHTRLMFFDPIINSTVDVFLDEFIMCHKLVLKDRLRIMKYTIPTSDLFLTKMQIIQLTENDEKDIAALLYDVELGERDDEKTMDYNYIAKILSEDWGFYKTYTINHEKILKFLINDKNREIIEPKLLKLREIIEKHPKSIKWKMRAKIGEKVKWYEEPEEVNTNFTQ